MAKAWHAMLVAALAMAGCAVAAAAEPVAGPGVVGVIDSASRFGFELSTRWGQRLQGRFPQAEGEVLERPDGLREVRLRVDARSVEIVGHPRFTAITRGPRFFDAERYPELQFASDPYPEALLRSGGDLPGVLRIHGVQRREHFRLQPAACDRPGRDCDIVANGSVDRRDYDLSGWRVALREEVRFVLQVRIRDVQAEAVP